MALDLAARAKKVKLLLMDCDGVLTDGTLYFDKGGECIKAFNVKDGQGLANWHRAGFISGIISGRNSATVEHRANELGIRFVVQGSTDKVADFVRIIGELELEADEVCYIGDDLPDIPLLMQVGLSATVADSAEGLAAIVHLVTKNRGGKGAVRELCDLLIELKSIGRTP